MFEELKELKKRLKVLKELKVREVLEELEELEKLEKLEKLDLEVGLDAAVPHVVNAYQANEGNARACVTSVLWGMFLVKWHFLLNINEKIHAVKRSCLSLCIL